MMLFLEVHNQLIIDEIKKWTIRKGNRSKRYKIGGIHKCKNKMFSKDYFAKIRILSLTVKKFKDLNKQDAKDDLCNSVEQLKKVLQNINNNTLKNNTVMSKINFERVII